MLVLFTNLPYLLTSKIIAFSNLNSNNCIKNKEYLIIYVWLTVRYHS